MVWVFDLHDPRVLFAARRTCSACLEQNQDEFNLQVHHLEQG
jgi:hypothetical protein